VLHGLVDPLTALEVLQVEPRPQAMRSSWIPKMVTPRMASRVPSARVPYQCHSAQPVSPAHADRSSSARKSGTPAKTSAQFFRTCSLPTNDRPGCTGCSLR
jgi:hypothetical protein